MTKTASLTEIQLTVLRREAEFATLHGTPGYVDPTRTMNGRDRSNAMRLLERRGLIVWTSRCSHEVTATGLALLAA